MWFGSIDVCLCLMGVDLLTRVCMGDYRNRWLACRTGYCARFRKNDNLQNHTIEECILVILQSPKTKKLLIIKF